MRSREDRGGRSDGFLPSELEFVNTQLLDAKFQSRMRQAQPLGSPVLTRDPAV